MEQQVTLFLDLGSFEGSMALTADDRVLAMEKIGNRLSDSALVPLYKSLLKKAGIDQKDLTRIACVTGPGGFTSLRCAVSFTNALSFALKIPSAGIHLSDIYQKRGSGIWLHSTRKTALFVRSKKDEPHLVDINQLQENIGDAKEWVGELIPEQKEIVASLGLTEAKLLPLDQILPSVLSGIIYEQKTLEPWYGRGF